LVAEREEPLGPSAFVAVIRLGRELCVGQDQWNAAGNQPVPGLLVGVPHLADLGAQRVELRRLIDVDRAEERRDLAVVHQRCA
jgi:hypothetical protein